MSAYDCHPTKTEHEAFIKMNTNENNLMEQMLVGFTLHLFQSQNLRLEDQIKAHPQWCFGEVLGIC